LITSKHKGFSFRLVNRTGISWTELTLFEPVYSQPQACRSTFSGKTVAAAKISKTIERLDRYEANEKYAGFA
jgi:hypothetical protein